MKTKQMFAVALFSLAFVALDSFAEYSIYTIDDTMQAVFPHEPTFTGEAGSGTSKMRGYNYMDTTNLIVYTANYSLNPIPYKETEIRKEIERFVRGGLAGINGRLMDIEYVKIGSDHAAHYSLQFNYQGISGRKFSAVIFHNGRFFVWTVQDIPAASRLHAKTIFNNYVQYFTLKE
jgi:hypothetical protein